MLFFIHLKLEIALAIPASNEWNIPTNNLEAHGLTFTWLIRAGFSF